MTDSDASPEFQVTLRSFAVELDGFDVEPQYISPIAFATNQVSDQNWGVYAGALLGYTDSSFRYTNGVSVAASNDFLRFQHSDRRELDLGNVESAEMAKRYVEAYDVARWEFVVHEFQGIIEVTDGSEVEDMSSGWSLFRECFDQNGTPILLRAGVLHPDPERSLQTDVYQTPDSHGVALEFASNLHHRFRRVEGASPVSLVTSILSEWLSDWSDVETSIRNLMYSIRTRKGEHVGYH